MSGALFQILIVGVALYSVISGFRRGMLRQLGSVAGVVVGALADHAFHDAIFQALGGDASGDLMRSFFLSTLVSSLIFITFYCALTFVSGLVLRVVSLIPGGMLGSISGALWSLFKSMLLLSLCYNLFLGLSGNEALLKCGRDSDGNLAGAVLELAPAVLDFDGVGSLCHKLQLREAAKISFNNNNPAGVNTLMESTAMPNTDINNA